ncbi:uncharacterized protein LOC117225151 [Megalopta genalis]|uniref:uncharacterized protein LOC117225151 n=1 Tax=Megalopta genalis TaxID=115081 RepID=UPI003FD32B11
MKLSVLIILLSFILQVNCGVLVVLESKENGTEAGEQRSARVHRVASNDFHETGDDIYVKNAMDPETTEQTLALNNRKREKFAERADSTHSETELFKYLKTVLKDMSRDGAAVASKNVDLEYNERTEVTESPTSIKSLPRNAIISTNLLNLPEDMDIYYSSGQNFRKSTKTGHDYSAKSNDSEPKMIKNIEQYLDRLLTDIQNHVTYIRNILERLCWKHRSKSLSQPEGDILKHPPATIQQKRASTV